MFVMIVGGGRAGEYLAELLLEGGHQVRVIENQRSVVATLQGNLPKEVVVAGSGTDPDLLEATGIRKADVLAAVTGSDEINLVATSLARFEFNVPRTIGRVNHPKNAWMFSADMGVDVALNQADLLGRMILEEMSLGDMMTVMKFRKGLFSFVEEKVDPGSPAVGQAIAKLGLPDQVKLVAILRKGEMLLPGGDVVLQPADEVLAVVHQSQLQTLASLLGRG